MTRTFHYPLFTLISLTFQSWTWLGKMSLPLMIPAPVLTFAIDFSLPGLTVCQLLSKPGLEPAMAGRVLVNMYPHCLVGD